MSDGVVKILDGNTFVVSDDRGDIEASPTDPTGLFSFDTRFLSRWVLTVNGERLSSLSVDDLQYFESRFFLVPGTGKSPDAVHSVTLIGPNATRTDGLTKTVFILGVERGLGYGRQVGFLREYDRLLLKRWPGLWPLCRYAVLTLTR